MKQEKKMDSIRNLIDAIAADKPVDARDVFDTIMSQRVSERIDDYRQEVAKNMFASPEEVQEEEPTEESTEDQ